MAHRPVVPACAALLAACALAAAAPAAPREHPSRADAVAASLRAALPGLMKAADVPGASAAVVRGGEVVWTGAFGVANAVTGAPVTDASVFEAASLTKPVFAYGVMKLVEAGRLDLDRPLASYLPAPYLADERAKAVTARHVLSHQTGFPNWRRGTELTMSFAPGDRFSYSGEGYVYLQRVVERITGEPLEAYMRRAVFEPLGMRDSSLLWLDRYDAAKVYGHDAVGEIVGRRKHDEANAAATLHTTAADYGRFVAAVLGRKGLGASTFDEMLRPQVWVSDGCVQCPEAPAGARSKALGWGLGWGLERGAAGDWFWHWGDNGTAKAFVLAGGPDRVGVVLLTNGETGLGLAREALARALGGERPQFAWLHVPPVDAPSRMLLKAALSRGTSAVAEYRARRGAAGRIPEDEANSLGYTLLRKNRVAEAVEVFRLNAEDFPASPNVHDSLGEAYAVAGRREEALASYRRVLGLKPGDANATAAVARLEAPAADVAPDRLRAYAGRYGTPFGELTVALEGGRLWGEVAGYGRSVLVARSETRFETLTGQMAVTFERDGSGRVTHATVEAGGQTVRAARAE